MWESCIASLLGNGASLTDLRLPRQMAAPTVGTGGNNRLRAAVTRSYIRAVCLGSEVLLQLLLAARQMFLQTQLGRPHVNMSESGFPLALVFEIISHKLAHSDWADCIHLAKLIFLRKKKWLGVNQLLFCVLHVLLSSIRFCWFVAFEMKMIQHLSCCVSCVSHLWTFFSIVYKLRCLIQPPADLRAATVATALPSESWTTATEETLLRLQAGPPTLVSAVCFEDLWAGFHQS